jgi:hypothetical protein
MGVFIMGRHWRRGALAVVLVTCMAVPVTNAIARATKAASLPYYLPPKVVGAWNRNVTQANWSNYKQSGFPVGVWTIVVSKGGGVKVYTPGGYRPGCISHAQGDRRQAVRATRSTLHRPLATGGERMHNAPVDHHDGPHQLIQIPVHCQGNLSGVRSPRPASAP